MTTTNAKNNRLTSKPKTSKGGTNPCLCLMDTEDSARCGRTTKRKYAQGHDAKTKAVLLTAWRSDPKATVIVDGAKMTVVALMEALGWSGFLVPDAKAKRAAAKAITGAGAAKGKATRKPRASKTAHNPVVEAGVIPTSEELVSA